MSKRIFKKFVAALALVAMLAETGYEDISMVTRAYASEEDIEVIPAEDYVTTETAETVETMSEEPFEPEIIVTTDDVSGDIGADTVYVEPADTDASIEDELLSAEGEQETLEPIAEGEVLDGIGGKYKDIYDDRFEMSGYDSLTLHVVTGQMNMEDSYRILLYGPSTMEYKSLLDYTMTKEDQGTYYIEEIDNEEFKIEVEVSDGMTYEFEELENGDLELEFISAPEPEAEKILEANPGSVSGSGYDSVTISLDTSALKKDTQYFCAYITTDAQATCDGEVIENGIIPSLSNIVTSLRIDDLDKKDFSVYLEAEQPEDGEKPSEGIIAEFSVESVENGLVNAVITPGETESVKRVYTYEDDQVCVTATLEVIDAIPDDAEFVVKPVTSSTPGYNYDAYMQALNENAESIADAETINDATEEPVFTEENTLLYDIAFFGYDDDGNYVELQPEEGSVRISVQFKSNQLEEELGAQENEDISVIHMPLTEDVKESVDSTEDATNISAGDIKVEVVAQSASVEGENSSFTLSDFSLTAFWANGKNNIDPGPDATYTSALGNARFFGVTANSINLAGHMETNFATGALSGNAGINSCKNDGGSGGETYIGSYTGSGFTMDPANTSSNKDIVIFTTPAAYKQMGTDMTNGRSHVVVNTSKYSESDIKNKVSTLVKDAQTNSKTLASVEGYNFFDIAKKPAAGQPNSDKYVLDIAKMGTSDSGTYYIDFKPGKFSEVGTYVINLKSNQRVVFNIPDSEVSFGQFMYSIDGGKLNTTSGDSVDDAICQRLIFNCPNATTAYTSGPTAGCFLVPFSDFSTKAVAAGWVVANTISSIGGQEWHCVWHDMPDPDPTSCSFVIRGKKTVEGKTPSAGQVFTFGLYDWNGNPVKDENGNLITATNDANGNIVFPEMKFAEDNRGHKQGNEADTRAYSYTIKEIPDANSPYYCDDQFTVTIYVHTDKNGSNSITCVRISVKKAGGSGYTDVSPSWGINNPEDYVKFDNKKVEEKPDFLEIKVNKTFEGTWDDDTQVKVAIEKYKMGGIDDVPDYVWNQIVNKEIILTPKNPVGSFGKVTFNADPWNGGNPGYGSPEGTVKYHVYMFKITESLVKSDSTVEMDVAKNLGYTVEKKGVRYLKVFVNTVTKDWRVFEAKVDARLKGNVNANTELDCCQGNTGTIEYINRRTVGDISLIKKDADTKHTLDGVKFKLFTSSNSPVMVKYDSAKSAYVPVKSGGSYDMSTVSGAINVKGLAPGSYYFAETATIGGYNELKNTKFSFTIDSKGGVSNISAANNGVYEFTQASSGKIATYTVYNEPKTGKVEIEKVSTTGAALSGVKFDLYKVGQTDPIATLTTDNYGKASKDGLKWGEYVLKEQDNPRYVKNTDEYTFYIDNTVQSVSFTGSQKIVNTPIEGSFKLTKIADNKPLKDAVFSIKKVGGNLISATKVSDGNYEYALNGTTQFVTNDNGEINVTKLPSGEYEVVEVSSPTGYVITSAYTKTFKIENNGDAPALTITNDKVSANIKFVKVDEIDNNKKLEGTEFTLTGTRAGSTTSENFGTAKADKDGVVSFEGLGCGKYTITETKALDGYVYDSSAPLTISVEITDADNAKTIYLNKDGRVDSLKSAIITNKEEDGTVTIEKKSDAGKLLSGVKFKLYTKDDKAVVTDGTSGEYIFERVATIGAAAQELETDANGKIVVSKLPWGTYYFKETSGIAGFVADTKTEYEFTIGRGSLNDATYTGNNAIVNDTVEGYVKLIKVDADDTDGTKLSGVEFDLYKADGITVEKEGLLTNNQGVITYGPVKYGTYYFKEKSTVAGYILSNGEALKVVVDEPSDANTIKEAATVTATNERIPGSITLNKYDAATSEKLDGAVFELWSTNGKGLVKTVSSWLNNGYSKYDEYTVENGTITVDNLPWGKYKFKEITAPAGYKLPENESERWTKEVFIGVDNGTEKLTATLDVPNDQQLGKIKLVKSDGEDSSKKLNGGQFRLYNENGEYNQVVYSLTDGEIVVTDLPFGSYYFVETEAPEGYVTPTSDAAKSTVATLNATSVEASVESPVTATLSNTMIYGGFELTKVDGTKKLSGATFSLYADTAKKNQIKTSGSAGVYVYDANGSTAAMATNEAGVLKVTGLPYGTYYVFEETAPAGYMPNTTPVEVVISVNNEVKTFDFTNSLIKAGVTFTKAEQNADGYTKLDGAVFELFILEEKDGVVTPKSMGNISGVNGVFTREELGAGSYVIKETKAPTGYKDNTKEYTFSISASDNGTVKNLDNPDGTVDGKSYVINTRQEGKARIKKVGNNTNGAGLAGATFDVYQKGGSAAYISDIESDENGYVVAEGLPWGEYYFVETGAPAGYAKDATHYEFTIDAQHTDVTLGRSAVNTYILGQAQLIKRKWDTKKNAATNKPLEGAVFDLYQVVEGEEEGSIVAGYEDGLTSGSDGKVTTAKDLPVGSYYFKERTAPKGYKPSETKFEFSVTEDNYTDIIIPTQDGGIAYNKPELGKVKLFKYETLNADGTTTMAGLSSVTFELYQKNDILWGLISTDKKVGEYSSDSNGIVTAEGLDWGEYYFVEKSAPEGYAENKTPIAFTIDKDCQDIATNAEGRYILSLENERINGSIKLVKTDSADESKLLAGAKFKLHKVVGTADTVVLNPADAVNGYYTTDADGAIVVDNLEWANYYFEEAEAPEGYITPTGSAAYTDTVSVDAAHTSATIDASRTISFTNGYAYGNVQITKTDDNLKPLSGAKFALYSYAGGAKAAQISVSDSGNGTYAYSTESTDVVMVSPASGVVKVTGLPYGTYAFVETEAPKGYVRNINDFVVKVTANQSADETALTDGSASCVNGTLSANAKLYKAWSDVDGTKPLAGAEFKLYIEGLEDAVATQASDENGEVLFTNLTEGKYTVKETATPNNAYEPFGGELSFEITKDDDGKTVEINTAADPVINVPIKGSASLIKHYKVGQDVAGVLSGVTFGLYKGTQSEGGVTYAENPFVTQVTDKDGKVEFENLDWGYYAIKEDQSNLPAGYVGTDEVFEFVINADTLATKREYHAYNNRKGGELELEKIDKTSRTALTKKETTFALVGMAADAAEGAEPIYSATLTTDENGKIHVTNLPWGNYTLTEKTAQTGYVLDGKKYTFTINGTNLKQSYTADAAIENTKITGSVELEKIDSKTKRPMPEVVFKLYKDDEPGKGIYTDESHINGQFTTDTNGKLSIEGLEYGWYHFEEITPNGYKPLTQEQLNKLKFQIQTNGQKVSLIGDAGVENTPSDGKVKLVKKDETGVNPVSGAVFSLYGSDPETFGQTVNTLFNDGYYYIGTYVTNGSGEITVDHLPWQSYYFVEKDKDGKSGVPAGYSSDNPDRQYKFEINAENCVKELSYTVNATNKKINGSLLLTKVDPSKKKDGKEYTLAGAKFDLWMKAAGGDVNITTGLKECVDGHLITDANGQIKVEDVEWGDYYFVEVEAPEGYDIIKESDGTSKKYPVSVNATNWNAATSMMEVQTAKVENSEIYGYVELNKRLIDAKGETVDISGKDLSGIEFAILAADGKTVVKENLQTDASGTISADAIGALPFGNYYFKEISVPATLGSFPVNDSLLPFEIRETNAATDAVAYTFDNSEVLGGAKIKKTDKTSGAGVKGIVFDLYYENGVLKGSYTTDETGYAKAEGLALGKYYFIENEESAKALGYTAVKDQIPFEITESDSNVVKDLGVVENERINGSISLTKLGKSSLGTKSVIALNKESTARFELYREGQEKAVKSADELYALYNDTGVITVTDLPWGKYYFKEIKAPKGYELPANPVSNTVEINSKTVTGSIETPLSASITDDTIRVYVSKVEIGGTSEIPGATLQLFKANALGSYNKNSTPVKEWTSTDKPYLIEIGEDFGEGLIPGVVYVLHEKTAPNGYALTDDITFTVDESGNVSTKGRKAKSESGLWTIFMEDNRINVYIDKKAMGETGNVTLTGATLAVMDGETVVDSWITTGETHKIKNTKENPLVIGKEYTLVELSAPKGYYTAEPITFKILDNGHIQIVQDASAMAKVDDKYATDNPDEVQPEDIGSTLTMFDRPIKLVVSKKRASGGDKDYVKGATLALYNYDKDVKGATAIHTWETSGSDDVIPYGILEVGHKYIIEEIEAPAGYAPLDNPVIFTVDDFDPKKRTDENQLIPQQVRVLNELQKIEVSKKALKADGPELKGAILEIVDEAGEKIAGWISDEIPALMTTLKEDELSDSERAAYAGYQVIYGVNFEEGKAYKLVEREAPYGYVRADSVEFTIVNGKPDTSTGTVVMVDNKDGDAYKHVEGSKRWLLYRDENHNIIPDKTYADVTVYLEQNGNKLIDLDRDGKGDKEFNITIKNGAKETDGVVPFVFGVDEDGNDILPVKDPDGNDYKYSIGETGNGTYEPIISMASFEAFVTNRPIVDPFEIRGEKVWFDPDGSLRPDVTIQLWRDGKFFKETPLLATQTALGVKYTFGFKNLWEYNFGYGDGEDLATADGHKFKYEIKEVGATGYVLSVNMNNGSLTTIVPEPIDGVVNCELTNTIENEYIVIRGTKYWDDMGDASRRPAIKVNLYATYTDRENVLVDTIDLPNTATSYAFGVDGRVKLPKYDEKGKVIKYTIGETVPEGFGYTSRIVGNDIFNTPSRVLVSKLDAATGRELPGALMAVYDARGREVERWRSTSSTHYIEGLVPGDTYTLRELEAPTGYVLASDVTFTVNTDGTEQRVRMEDPRITGSVTLTKKDATTRDNISGAVFNLYTSSGALVNVVGSLGSYEYYDGSASTSLSVSTAGTLTVTGLPYGEYYFREVTPPRGYELSTEASYFTIASDRASAEVTYLNTKLTGRARLTKIGSGSGATLAGATFELYSKTPRTAGQAVGGTLYSDVYYLYGTYTTDSYGRLDISGLPWDDYYFIETEAPEGYVLDVAADGSTPVYAFTVESETVSTFTIDLGTITNDPGTPPPPGGGGGGGVAGVRRLKGSGVSGVLGVRSAPTSGVLGARVGPTTGDAANIALWLVLLLASISVIVAICVTAGKKRKKSN